MKLNEIDKPGIYKSISSSRLLKLIKSTDGEELLVRHYDFIKK